MGTPLQNQTNAVLNAIDDGACAAIITLYDKGYLARLTNRNDDILYYFGVAEITNEAAIDYWMEYLR